MKKTKFDLWVVLHPERHSGCFNCKHWQKYNICFNLGNKDCDLFLKKEGEITEEEWARTFPHRKGPIKEILF
ncbi:MAG: hypothetical protein WC495_07005 [Patescibacteria group bacterium]